MLVRSPVRAGMFYPASAAACRQQAQALLDTAAVSESLSLPRYGGLVPHAGWVYSGWIAAQAWNALLTQVPQPQTVILFGADHTGLARVGEAWTQGAWETPVGSVAIDQDFAAELLAATDLIHENQLPHNHEHSLEVQIPFLQLLNEQCKIVPIMLPVDPMAVDVGRVVGQLAATRPAGSVVIVGSTDLTHHGGHFGNPGGYGPASEAYARENDSRMISLVETLQADSIIPEAVRHQNACGPGAIAATIAACRQMGATAGEVLAYTNSYEVTHRDDPADPDDTAVGYLSAVFV